MTRTLAAFATALFAAPLAVAADPAPGSAETAKAAQTLKIEGMYTFQRGEKGGQAIPPERLQGAQVVISGDEMIGSDTKKKQIFVAKYKLDATKKPFRLTMTSTVPATGEAVGLLEKRGEELWLIYNLPGGAAPEDFRTREQQQLFVLVQQKDTKSSAEQIGK